MSQQLDLALVKAFISGATFMSLLFDDRDFDAQQEAARKDWAEARQLADEMAEATRKT